MSKDDKPVFRNKRIILFGEIIVDEHSKCVFEPWMSAKHNIFGWNALPAGIEGRAYIYIAPDTWSHDDKPRFYLYIGPHGDPAKDRRLGPYDLEGGEANEQAT